MLKKIVLLAFLLFCTAEHVLADDFKAVGLTLGESLQTATEKFQKKGIPLVKEEGDLYRYAHPLVKLSYGSETELEFFQGKLMRVRVYLKMPNERFQDFKEHYATFKAALEKKYGRPAMRRELIPRSFNGNLSAKMLEGDIGYGAVFKSDDIEIGLMLKKSDRRTYRYFLEYVDSALRKEKQDESESNLDVL